MAYVIIVHLLYLLTSILYFDIIRGYYTLWVQLNLLEFMSKIREMLLKSSTFLHALMEILILHFCVMINYIFDIIKAKLLFYLDVVHTFILVDMFELYFDIESFNKLLSKLQSEIDKYIKILVEIKGLLTGLKKLIKHNKKLKDFINHIDDTKKIIVKLYEKISYENNKISKITYDLSSIKLEKNLKLKPNKKYIYATLKKDLQKLNKLLSSTNIHMNNVSSLISKFQESLKSIKKLLEMMEMIDLEFSTGIIPIIEQLLKVEKINLRKLNLLIKSIKLLHLIILIRGYLLLCTILFYEDVTVNVLELFKLMNFDCSNAMEFLTKTSGVDKYIKSTSDQIDSCIKKLSQACNTCKDCLFRKQPIDSFIKLVQVISVLKFYVDLMAMEILIFKSIILTLIEMTVSSAIIEFVEGKIGEIKSIEDAITTLIVAKEYLRTFHFIQLHNSMTIFGLSSLLLFSESIHQHFQVLLFNLQSIKLVIWGIECYIEHLIVFKYTSVCLNSLKGDIQGLGNIIVQISNVVKSLFTITDKLLSINNSIKQLYEIQDSMDITNFKESAAKIRQETQSFSRDIGEINSQITKITGFVRSILTSWTKLVSLYYFLFGLISQVHKEIEKTNKYRILETRLENEYYKGVIGSVMEPCNKQLKFILTYLVDMWLCIASLIKFVQNTMLVIYGMMGWLYGLTTVLKEDVDKINKGVVDVECAIEGVAMSLIRCSTKQLSCNIAIIENNNLLDMQMMSMY